MSTTRTRPVGQLPARPRHVSVGQLTTGQQRWQAYEAAKCSWEAANPGASSEQYETAMQEIARRYGL
jgi:hypothetical protein